MNQTTMKTLLLSILLFCTQPAFADLAKGLDAAQKGDFATALKEWQPLAEQGNAVAQFNLGVMYENGQGVTQDYKTAVKYYTLAAEQGYADAQFSLGYMYENGEGTAQDYKAAIHWYTKGAEQGDAHALSNLSLMYLYGRGTAQDYKKALHFGTKASEQGNTNALATFGREYSYTIQEIIRDKNEAQKMKLELMAEGGYLKGQMALGEFYIEEKYYNQNYKRAVYWYIKAAEQGSSKAGYMLGMLYFNGFGVLQDYPRAHAWFNIAVSLGDKKSTTWREEVVKVMTAVELEEARKLASECVAKDYKGC